MNVRIALVCLMLAAACTQATPHAQPKAASTTAQPTSAHVAGVIVAVARGKKGVALYRIGRDRHPVLIQSMRVPPCETPCFGTNAALDVTLSAGPRPTTCVLWVNADSDGASGNDLWCYAFGDVTGAEVVGGGSYASGPLALRADGTALA